MRLRILVLISSMLSFLAAFGQEENDNRMKELTVQCSQIVELNQRIESLNKTIDGAYNQIDSIRSAWHKVCMEYIHSSDVKLSEDFNYLIANTDSIFDGAELYNLLVTESKKVQDDNYHLEPVPVTQPGVSVKPVEEPRPVITRDDDKKKRKDDMESDDLESMKSKIKSKEDKKK